MPQYVYYFLMVISSNGQMTYDDPSQATTDPVVCQMEIINRELRGDEKKYKCLLHKSVVPMKKFIDSEKQQPAKPPKK